MNFLMSSSVLWRVSNWFDYSLVGHKVLSEGHVFLFFWGVSSRPSLSWNWRIDTLTSLAVCLGLSAHLLIAFFRNIQIIISHSLLIDGWANKLIQICRKKQKQTKVYHKYYEKKTNSKIKTWIPFKIRLNTKYLGRTGKIWKKFLALKFYYR